MSYETNGTLSTDKISPTDRQIEITDWGTVTLTNMVAQDGIAKLATILPSSLLYQFRAEDITASDGATSWTWPEREQGDDMSVNGATYDSTLFGGAGGASADGADDYAETSTMGSFGSDLGTDFAIAFTINTTDNAFLFSSDLDASNGFLQLRTDSYGNVPSGSISMDIRDADSNNLRTWSSTAIDDGATHSVIINKVGNTGSGAVEYYLDGDASTAESNVGTDQGISNFADFANPATYFANYDGSSYSGYLAADLKNFMWFSASLSESERQDVFEML